MIWNATKATPATTARKATAKAATRAGSDTGYHLVPAQVCPLTPLMVMAVTVQ